MNFLKYSNLNNINIIPQDDFSELIRDVFEVVATNISRSLGPLGSSAIIFDGAISESTKDGFSILKKYLFTNLYKQMVLDMIKRPCVKMNNTVGDGTTTAIVLAQRMFEIYQTTKSEIDPLYRLPREFVKVWDKTVQRIQDRINEMKKPLNIDNHDAYKIAYVSTNGNVEVASEIEKVYEQNPSPYIHIKDSGTNKSYLKAVSGFEFPCNIIDRAYTRTDDFSAEFNEPWVIVFDHTLDVNNFEALVIPLNELARFTNRSFIVVAPKFEKTLCETDLHGLYNHECQQYAKPSLYPCQYSSGDIKEKQLEDLAAVLNCNVITKELEERLIETVAKSRDEVWEGNDDPDTPFYRTIGYCEKMSTSYGNGSIFEVVEICESHEDAIREAKRELGEIIKDTMVEEQNISVKTVNARERLTRLEMNNYIYYIGADSELQKQILRDSVDDAVKCLRSASTNGIVPGCQITLYKAAKEIAQDEKSGPLTKAIATIIYLAAAEVYKQVLTGPNTLSEEPKLTLSRIKDCSMINGENVDWEELLGMVLDNIVEHSVESNMVYDLELQMYSDRVITSAETDLMVLSAASELVKILISGNQCIFVDPLLNAKDEKEIYSFK